MARRAVQGYTDKTYFENTRFSGMLATNDPQLEGYFKHLVNLDISDTGQSLKPRTGYLTTSLLLGSEIISLSEETIIYRNSKTQSHVIYDFKTNRGFLADISRYTSVAQMHPCTYPYLDLLSCHHERSLRYSKCL